ncbi:glycosyltransferase [sulfur-oxidizing endosymbiont of Gigantopelta aegis]|uniref:glycosyltransferase n=1 Tax=sulfur-oxidizing endosymbiont of Gigantopelta aegis TaxID=2794934 RepID=UPI002483BE14|nr:glycosyltransferase [sulfur-oxidizing endosymbiont of Gigantopelta aegis]
MPLKRLDLIVDALSELNDIKEEIEWHHFGSGSEMRVIEDGLCKINNVNINVFFNGHLENEKILERYQLDKFNLFVNVSDSEGIPVSIMEAMSFGIPCLARNVGGISEIINSENGYLLENEIDAKYLSNVLKEIIFSREKLNIKSFNAFKTWEKHFNADINFPLFSKSLLDFILSFKA